MFLKAQLAKSGGKLPVAAFKTAHRQNKSWHETGFKERVKKENGYLVIGSAYVLCAVLGKKNLKS